MDQVQIKQEEEYSFPYHYISKYDNKSFSHCLVDSWSIHYASTIEFLLSKIDLKADNRVVDIGCGDGRFSRELACAFPGVHVTGLDYSAKAINLALAMNSSLPNIEFLCLDINKRPLPRCRYDMGILMEVFEHIPVDDARAFIDSVRCILVDGAELHITVPHVNKPTEYKHFQHFTIDSVLSYLGANFEILEVIPIDKKSKIMRIIDAILVNRYFILNNKYILYKIYNWYKRNLFLANSEEECERLYFRVRAV